MITKEQFEAKTTADMKHGLQTFMSKPTIRLLISTIPEAGQETITTLLNESFQQGWNSGQGSLSLMMIERILDPRNLK